MQRDYNIITVNSLSILRFIFFFFIFIGAIKLNYSARLSALVVRFCDKDLDLIEIQILGLENDCIYTANERMVLRAHLRHLSIDDLSEDTLYSKVNLELNLLLITISRVHVLSTWKTESLQDFNHGRGQGSRLEVREAHAKIVQMFGHRHEAGRRDVGRDVQAFHWENELRAHLQNSVRPEGINSRRLHYYYFYFNTTPHMFLIKFFLYSRSIF